MPRAAGRKKLWPEGEVSKVRIKGQSRAKDAPSSHILAWASRTGPMQWGENSWYTERPIRNIEANREVLKVQGRLEIP
jgi:hypothetical protein